MFISDGGKQSGNVGGTWCQQGQHSHRHLATQGTWIFFNIYEFMHGFWTIPTASMTYTRSQTCTNMVGGKHLIHTIKVMVVVLLLLLLLFDGFVRISAHPLFFMDNCVVEIYSNLKLRPPDFHLDLIMLPWLTMKILGFPSIDQIYGE